MINTFKIKKRISEIIMAIGKKFNMAIRFYYPKFSTNQIKHKFGDKELVGAEIGVWLGENAENLFKNLNIKKLYLIDPYNFIENYKDYNLKEIPREDNLNIAYEKAVKKLDKYKGKTKFIKDLSENASKRFKDNSLDFVYIDANHKYEYVKKDIELWWKKIKNGGILAGHDIDKPEIFKAVAEFIVDKKLTANVNYRKSQIKIDFQDWVLIK